MPDVLIEVRGSWLRQRKPRFIDAVRSALVQVLRVPEREVILRLVEHAPGNVVLPLAAGERFSRIEVAMFEGRTVETRRALLQTIIDAVASFGVPKEDVKIVLIEIPLENVSIRGQAASDIDLGYKILV